MLVIQHWNSSVSKSKVTGKRSEQLLRSSEIDDFLDADNGSVATDWREVMEVMRDDMAGHVAKRNEAAVPTSADEPAVVQNSGAGQCPLKSDEETDNE